MTAQNSADFAGAGRQPWTFPETLQELLGAGDEEFLSELIDAFTSQTRERMPLLRDAVNNGRVSEVRTLAHAIRGGAKQLGADRLSAVCLALESAASLTAAETGALCSQAELLFEDACRRMVVK